MNKDNLCKRCQRPSYGKYCNECRTRSGYHKQTCKFCNVVYQAKNKKSKFCSMKCTQNYRRKKITNIRYKLQKNIFKITLLKNIKYQVQVSDLGTTHANIYYEGE